ncbi:hypothetical protein L207DRAFT_304252 [Hyaloscypha variabilis F]|uniref:Uncharacterized protein n=1 Tax=Hyaloscypha variabilis (strain UAMH 11265 / GT02V1 / F) TaxID=1149755 RepID=A0A2J6QR80_HYAVF|nr:hypothetical protein L207DRAFT_304252 [Hyaloscypha variabilis F]
MEYVQPHCHHLSDREGSRYLRFCVCRRNCSSSDLTRVAGHTHDTIPSFPVSAHRHSYAIPCPNLFAPSTSSLVSFRQSSSELYCGAVRIGASQETSSLICITTPVRACSWRSQSIIPHPLIQPQPVPQAPSTAGSAVIMHRRIQLFQKLSSFKNPAADPGAYISFLLQHLSRAFPPLSILASLCFGERTALGFAFAYLRVFTLQIIDAFQFCIACK